MVRQHKDGMFYAECSHCKKSSGVPSKSPDQSLAQAEFLKGFASIGKFQFCRECYLDMVARWEVRNVPQEVISA
jgi:hypothetical protein